MKILFLNCANRKDCIYLKNYVISNNIDIVILAESKNVRKELSKEFKYTFLSSYKFGLTVLSRIPFKVEDIKYIIDDDRLRLDNDNYYERILNINIRNLNILAAHVDYGFYNPFAMIAIEEYLNSKDVDIIIGDFNSGFINDNLNYKTGGVLFQNGYLYFKKYEDKGYVDLNKNKGMYSFVTRNKTNFFRIDHCFVKDINLKVKYIDEFLEKNVSDHKGILVEKNI